jgi:serine/threonine protein kinase
MQRALLRTAAEVAKGIDLMHGLGVVHGDLKPANVLLKTHRADRRGYVAKVADFGGCLGPDSMICIYI